MENQLNHIERVEAGRINELEDKFMVLSDDYTRLVEENKVLKKNEQEMKKEIQGLVKGRDGFKEQFLELKEINRDLKMKFTLVEQQVSEYIDGEKRKEDQNKENKFNENKKKAMILEDL